MRKANVFWLVSGGFALVAACSSSSGSPAGGGSGNDAGGDGETSTNEDSSVGDDSSSGDDSSLSPFGDVSIMLTCMSAADCTEGGSGQVCCFSIMTFSTSCVPGQCAAGDYQQCAGSDSECPSGDQCIASPLGMGAHYCSGDAGVGPVDTGTADGAKGDAEIGDSGKSDAEIGDSGKSDAETADGGKSDAETADGAVGDGGIGDAGARDGATD
jgi:hypothetical protein